MNDRSKRWLLWPSVLLVGTLLAGPTIWAAQEDAQRQGAAEKTDKKQADEKRESSDTEAVADKPEPAVDSSFNTFEDVFVHRGTVRSLWVERVGSSLVVPWRDASVGKTRKR